MNTHANPSRNSYRRRLGPFSFAVLSIALFSGCEETIDYPYYADSGLDGGDVGPDAPPEVALSISLSETEVDMTEGQALTLTPTVRGPSGADLSVIWSSSVQSVATVEDGVIVAVSPGSATIRGTLAADSSVRAAVEVSVNRSGSGVRGLTVSASTQTLDIGQMVTLRATVDADRDVDTAVTWSAGSPSVASVTADGTVTAHAAGSATVTARSNADATYFAHVEIEILPDPCAPRDTIATGRAMRGRTDGVDCVGSDLDPAVPDTVTYQAAYDFEITRATMYYVAATAEFAPLISIVRPSGEVMHANSDFDVFVSSWSGVLDPGTYQLLVKPSTRVSGIPLQGAFTAHVAEVPFGCGVEENWRADDINWSTQFIGDDVCTNGTNGVSSPAHVFAWHPNSSGQRYISAQQDGQGGRFGIQLISPDGATRHECDYGAGAACVASANMQEGDFMFAVAYETSGRWVRYRIRGE